MHHPTRRQRGTSLPPTHPRPAHFHSLYEADVLEGLATFARTELEQRFGAAVRVLSSQRADALRFSYAGSPAELLDLRSVVAVYLSQLFPVPRPKALLGHQHFEQLIAQIHKVRELWPRNAFATLRLSAAGEESAVMQRLKVALAQRLGLTTASDEGDLLLRMRRAGPAGWETLVRLSPRPLATRPWRVCNRPGALNASAAYGMMHLTQPDPADRVLNLACGSGTLLVERLALGSARVAIGCDLDPAALDCAAQNLTAAGFADAVQLEAWDIGRLPLADGSVDVLCADLPFGQLIGSHRDNEVLYPRVFAEAARVAAAGARMVLFTHEIRLLERVADEHAAQWRLQQTIRVRVGGMTPRIYLFQRSE